jgi:hypothetical protein
MPPVSAAGVPLSNPPLKITPEGRVPLVMVTAGIGVPVVVTVNEPAIPAVNVALFALVKAGVESSAIELDVPVMEDLTVSVAVIVWGPGVRNVP